MYKLVRTTLFLLAAPILFAGCSVVNNTTDQANENTSVSDEVIADDSLLYEDEITIVEKDVYGKDLDLVERYPSSLRSYYEAYDDEISVTYQTTDDQEEVRTYFNEQLTAAGWTVDGDATDYTEYYRESDAGEEYLSVYYYPYESADITEYELYYEPPYTDEDLEEDEVTVDDEEIDIEL